MQEHVNIIVISYYEQKEPHKLENAKQLSLCISISYDTNKMGHMAWT